MKGKNAPQRLPRSFVGWIAPTYRFTEADIVRYGGTDAATYLRVQHFGRFAATQAVLHESLGIHLDKIYMNPLCCRLAVVPVLHLVVLYCADTSSCRHSKLSSILSLQSSGRCTYLVTSYAMLFDISLSELSCCSACKPCSNVCLHAGNICTTTIEHRQHYLQQP